MAQLKEGSIIRKSTGDEVVATLNDIPTQATQAEAEAGADDTKIMTPLKVKQVTEQFATKTELANIDLTEELENLATKTELADKVDKVSGKQLSTNDYTTTEKNKLSGIETGAQVNAVTSVNGQTGAVTTPNTTYDAATTTTDGLMSSADKVKLNGVETGAQKNIMTSADKVKLDKFTEIENKPYYNDEAIATVKDIPLNTSELTNDSGYVVQDGLDNRVRFITETEYNTLKTNNNIEENITYIIYR